MKDLCNRLAILSSLVFVEWNLVTKCNRKTKYLFFLFGSCSTIRNYRIRTEKTVFKYEKHGWPNVTQNLISLTMEYGKSIVRFIRFMDRLLIVFWDTDVQKRSLTYKDTYLGFYLLTRQKHPCCCSRPWPELITYHKMTCYPLPKKKK